MTKIETYRQVLKTLADWEPYLLQESGLPGPRGNLELAQVVADEGTRDLFARFLSYTPEVAPVNSPQEFLFFCGVMGLGRLLAEGDEAILETLRPFASDPRWRTREAVAMALQRLGKVNMGKLLEAMETWSTGNWYEKRAAAASLAEPALLHNEDDAVRALHILDRMTATMENSLDAKAEAFKVFQQGLSYCWSVLVAAAPAEGKRMMEKWLTCDDRLIRKVMQENLKKNRLLRMDAAWVEKWRI
jgi:HEAT repeat protein